VTPVQHAYHEELEYYEGRAHCASTATGSAAQPRRYMAAISNRP
jgi:hypothetical protein